MLVSRRNLRLNGIPLECPFQVGQKGGGDSPYICRCYISQVGWAEKPSIFVKIHAGLFSPAYLWPVQPIALWLSFLPPIHRAAILHRARFQKMEEKTASCTRFFSRRPIRISLIRKWKSGETLGPRPPPMSKSPPHAFRVARLFTSC